MSYLNNLTVTDIEQGLIPLQEILANSFYYPACNSDGGVVTDCNKNNKELGIDTFIYCDYAFGEERLNETMDTFHGYTVIATRSLKPNDLTPNGWRMKMPPRLDRREYTRYKDAYDGSGIWTRTDPEGNKWLNLDWFANHPGGKYFNYNHGTTFYILQDYCNDF